MADPPVPMIERPDGLFVPQHLAQQVREPARLDFPLSFHGGSSSSLVPMGQQPGDSELLRSITGWAAIAARVLSDRVMGLEPLVFVRRSDGAGTVEETQLDDHPLKAILDDPGPIFSRELLLRVTAYHLLQCGEAYWQKVRDGFGFVVELWPIPPQQVQLVPSAGPEVIAGYKVTDGSGGTTFLPREEVVRIWHPDPETLYGSLGVLGPQALEFDAQRYLAEHLKTHFERDATPRVAIVGDPDARAPEDEDLIGFLAAWANAYQSRKGTQAGTPAFIPPGFRPEVLDAHGDKAHLAPLNEAFASQILSAYGVSPISVGRDTNVNRATAETSGWLQDQNAVLPLTRVISSTLTRQLAREDFRPDDERAEIVVRFEDFIAPDKEFQLRRDAQYLATKRESVNQQRQRYGEDEVEWGEYPVGTLADTPYDGSAFDFGGGSEESAEDLTGRGEPEPARALQVRADITDLLWSRVSQSERKYLRRMEGAMASIFDVQRKAILAAMKKAGRTQRSEIDEVLEQVRWERLFEVRFEPLRKKALEESGQQMMLDLGDLGDSFSLTSTVQDTLHSQGSQLVANVGNGTKRLLNEALANGLEEGEGLAAMTKRVNKIMRNRRRSRTIARTELVKATQAGHLESFTQAGLEEHQWNTARDGNDRHPSRPGLDGQIVRVGDEFDLGKGFTATHPGADTLPAGEVINCQCFLSPVVPT